MWATRNSDEQKDYKNLLTAHELWKHILRTV